MGAQWQHSPQTSPYPLENSEAPVSVKTKAILVLLFCEVGNPNV